MSDLSSLLHALDLAADGPGRFIGQHHDEGHGVVFGGQLLAQTVVAAARTFPSKQVSSVHAIFARGASAQAPLAIGVDTVHDGRAFGSATVTMAQGERTCTRSSVLLHVPDDDLIRHADPMPAVDGPGACAPRGTSGFWDIRVVGDVDIADPAAVGPAELSVWTRFPDAPDDLVTSQALLGYASDGFLIGTAMRPHPGVGQSLAHVEISTTVLSHTLTFHEPFSAADWLLLVHESPYAGRGRAYGRAQVFTADGRLVASFVQEAMVRDFPEGQRPPAGERSKH